MALAVWGAGGRTRQLLGLAQGGASRTAPSQAQRAHGWGNRCRHRDRTGTGTGTGSEVSVCAVGLDLAASLLSSMRRAEAMPLVKVLTDGEQNEAPR